VSVTAELYHQAGRRDSGKYWDLKHVANEGLYDSGVLDSGAIISDAYGWAAPEGESREAATCSKDGQI
jgi:hypothetical protein